MRKSITALGATVLLSAGLVGCGSSETAEQDAAAETTAPTTSTVVVTTVVEETPTPTEETSA